MSAIYNPELIQLAEETGAELGLKLKKGVYVCLSGPSFETPPTAAS